MRNFIFSKISNLAGNFKILNFIPNMFFGKKNIQMFQVSRGGETKQAAPGFEPGNNGFANRRLRPLGYAAIQTVGNLSIFEGNCKGIKVIS